MLPPDVRRGTVKHGPAGPDARNTDNPMVRTGTDCGLYRMAPPGMTGGAQSGGLPDLAFSSSTASMYDTKKCSGIGERPPTIPVRLPVMKRAITHRLHITNGMNHSRKRTDILLLVVHG